MKRLAVLALILGSLFVAAPGAASAASPLATAEAAVSLYPETCIEQRQIIRVMGYGPAKRAYGREFDNHAHGESLFAGIYLVCTK